ncbi:MAG TPA: hypothetical protein PKD05_19230 [Candidatus Melainabacteria bacterium]|nr:hypothetical protein [Candidatus Melainabacteria bacterium]HMP53689.1 hypothetical protein [Candidatus Melainabacteria bacterium]
MKKQSSAKGTLVAILSIALLSAWATPAHADGKKDRLTALPKAVGGAIAGVTVGVPVNIGKSVKRMTFDMHDSISQNFSFSDEADMYSKVVAGILAVPYGLVGGCIYGTVKGLEKGVIQGSEKPFSKESFSLQ